MMIFSQPISFAEALDHELVKRVLPTTGGTADLATLAPEIRRRARFSARVNDLRLLERIDTMITRIVDPSVIVDPATGARRPPRPGEYMGEAEFRLGMQEALKTMGYQPAEEDRGTLRDLSSRARQDLIVNTNVRMAHEYGNWAQGQDPGILDVWPAQELIREESRNVPRDWRARWQAAGGRLYQGRMIALKNDPLWTDISRFELPYPPFDFGSGMGVADVDRPTAMAAGLIDRDTQVPPDRRPLNEAVSADVSNTPAWLVQQVIQAFGADARMDNGRLVLAAGRV